MPTPEGITTRSWVGESLRKALGGEPPPMARFGLRAGLLGPVFSEDGTLIAAAVDSSLRHMGHLLSMAGMKLG